MRERAASPAGRSRAHLGKIVRINCSRSRGSTRVKAQTEWTRFDLTRTCANHRRTNESAGRRQRGSVSISCDASQPMLVKGNRVRLKQSRCEPARQRHQIHAGKRRDSITHSWRQRSCTVLEVKDNGIGIPPDALPHIFERFYRVDQARSADSESAGLGLSIVKSICIAHGAEVEAQSTVGSGSCFRVKLPLSKN